MKPCLVITARASVRASSPSWSGVRPSNFKRPPCLLFSSSAISFACIRLPGQQSVANDLHSYTPPVLDRSGDRRVWSIIARLRQDRAFVVWLDNAKSELRRHRWCLAIRPACQTLLGLLHGKPSTMQSRSLGHCQVMPKHLSDSESAFEPALTNLK